MDWRLYAEESSISVDQGLGPVIEVDCQGDLSEGCLLGATAVVPV